MQLQRSGIGNVKQLLLLFALLLPITGAAEPIYKWKDAQGVVHFSTTPPKKQANTEVMAKPELQKISDDVSQMTADEDNSNATANKQATESTEESQQKTKEELAYCNTLQGNMTMLNSSPRVRIKNKDGEYEVLDDTARQKEISRIKKLLNEFCKN